MISPIYRHLAVLLLTLPLPCLAGVQELNDAIGRNDYAAAAAETEAIWRNYDKGRPDAFRIAREFAFVHYMAGDVQTARDYTRYLTGKNALEMSDDDLPGATGALVALVNFGTKPSKRHRGELFRALRKRVAQPGYDAYTEKALQVLYLHDWEKGDWHKAAESSALASRFFSRAGDAAVSLETEARMISSVSRFLPTRTTEAYYELVELHNFVTEDIAHLDDPGLQVQLLKQRWTVFAWVRAIEAFYRTYYGKPGGYRLTEDIDPRPLEMGRYKIMRSPEPEDSRPLCQMDFEYDAPHYPGLRLYEGFVGVVILMVDFDEEGRAHNGEILASVPVPSFGKSVLAVVESMHRIAKPGEDVGKCRVSERDVVIPITFEII
ncbi:MAG: energy transducer TonB [Pseudomonadales bacterium]|nr:energy transducer TonB [Pseudomonadales bacterium]